MALDSSNVEALNQLAFLHSETRDEPRAEQLFRRALVVEPDNGILLGNLAVSFLNQQKLDAADSAYGVVRTRNLPIVLAREEATVLYLRGEIDSAEARAWAGLRSPKPGMARGMAGLLRQLMQVRGAGGRPHCGSFCRTRASAARASATRGWRSGSARFHSSTNAA